jgi:hypothetical protein
MAATAAITVDHALSAMADETGLAARLGQLVTEGHDGLVNTR